MAQEITVGGSGEAPRIQAIVKPVVFTGLSSTNPLVITPPDADSFIRLTLFTSQGGTGLVINSILVGGDNLLSENFFFNNIPIDQNDSSSLPARFTISSNFSAYKFSSNFLMQHLGVVIEPVVGGRGENIELTTTGASGNAIYAYEVWK